MQLLAPTPDSLPAVLDALERGWQPRPSRETSTAEWITDIRHDPEDFLDRITGRVARPYQSARGTTIQPLAQRTFWLWEDRFLGQIGLRWQEGTAELPPEVQGHVGYSVVDWERGHGYGRAALSLLLPEAQRLGLPHLDLVTAEHNRISIKIIQTNGGQLVCERTLADPCQGTRNVYLWRIPLG